MSIIVGFTHAHGMAKELFRHPPSGVEYRFLKSIPAKRLWLRSPIKGFFARYDTSTCDIVEAIIAPIETDKPWIMSCENLQAITAVTLLGLPIPRWVRVGYVADMLARDNCKRVTFWSKAGMDTLTSYGRVHDERILRKCEVLYPAVRAVPDELVRFRSTDDVQLLFTGEFFRKGGVNVLDAFVRARQEFPRLRLVVCCDEEKDFTTPNHAMRSEYQERLRKTEGVELLGRVARERLLNEILPETDVLLLPTYAETFGFSVLEAMAYGIPVITTDCFAMPELIEHGTSGFLIDIRQFDPERLFRGYVVRSIPVEFCEHVTDRLLSFMRQLVGSPKLRKDMGQAGRQVAQTRFSFEARNQRALQIYREALDR